MQGEIAPIKEKRHSKHPNRRNQTGATHPGNEAEQGGQRERASRARALRRRGKNTEDETGIVSRLMARALTPVRSRRRQSRDGHGKMRRKALTGGKKKVRGKNKRQSKRNGVQRNKDDTGTANQNGTRD